VKISCMKHIAIIAILFFVAIAASSSGSIFSPEPMILEVKDIYYFNITSARQKGGVILDISGLCFHSALAVKSMEIRRDRKDLLIHLHLAPASKGLSGSFNYSIWVPRGIEKVLLGSKKQVEIWPIPAKNELHLGKFPSDAGRE
jgi:hypothetical protein